MNQFINKGDDDIITGDGVTQITYCNGVHKLEMTNDYMQLKTTVQLDTWWSAVEWQLQSGLM